MTEIAFSSSFKRAFKKKVVGNPNLENRFWEKVEAFKNNPFDPKQTAPSWPRSRLALRT
jgi:hypothetical protein